MHLDANSGSFSCAIPTRPEPVSPGKFLVHCHDGRDLWLAPPHNSTVPAEDMAGVVNVAMVSYNGAPVNTACVSQTVVLVSASPMLLTRALPPVLTPQSTSVLHYQALASALGRQLAVANAQLAELQTPPPASVSAVALGTGTEDAPLAPTQSFPEHPGAVGGDTGVPRTPGVGDRRASGSGGCAGAWQQRSASVFSSVGARGDASDTPHPAMPASHARAGVHFTPARNRDAAELAELQQRLASLQEAVRRPRYPCCDCHSASHWHCSPRICFAPSSLFRHLQHKSTLRELDASGLALDDASSRLAVADAALEAAHEDAQHVITTAHEASRVEMDAQVSSRPEPPCEWQAGVRECRRTPLSRRPPPTVLARSRSRITSMRSWSNCVPASSSLRCVRARGLGELVCLLRLQPPLVRAALLRTRAGYSRTAGACA